MFYVHPYLGKWSNLTNIFQMGWNHQLVDQTQFFVEPSVEYLKSFSLGTIKTWSPQAVSGMIRLRESHQFVSCGFFRSAETFEMVRISETWQLKRTHVLGKSWKVSKNGDGGVFFDIQVLVLQYACSSLFILTCCRCWLWWKSPHNIALLSETSIDSRSTFTFSKKVS